MSKSTENDQVSTPPVKKLGVDYKVFPSKSSSKTLLAKILQILAVLVWYSILLNFIIVLPFALIYSLLFVNYLRVPALLYLGWVVYDKRGMIHGRKSAFVIRYIRYNPFWKHFQAYFDGKLIKTAELDPSKKYIMAVHPHGLYTFSVFANLWHSREFLTAFPGIKCFGVTLDANFLIPFWRDLCIAFGTGSSSKKAITSRLVHGEAGTAALIVVGGAREFKHMKAGTMDLVLKTRKGFIKLALETGTDLVPVLGFGENDLYSLVDHKYLTPLHSLFRILFRSAAPLFYGNNWGLPGRGPLNTVIGKPISVQIVKNPSVDEIDKLHEQYMNSVQQLYDDYKDLFYPNRKKEMTFI
jgi:2-acylglycerol O-acyltransferase 2